MCKFCNKIYPEKDMNDIVFAEGGPDSFIIAYDNGTYDIITNPGDPYELGYVSDIKFCPYCGMELPERIRFDNGSKYDIKIVTRGRCMMCKKDLTEGLFFCKECEEKVKYNLINHKEEEKPKVCCYKCAYYSESQYWSDNSVVVTYGSCTKCERNFVTSDPFNQIPSWCPLKGE